MAEPYYADATLTLLVGDAAEQLRTLDDGSAGCIVTSPPYFGLRDYGGHPDQLGLEDTPADYVARLAAVFRQARRVLADDGTLWLNLGDSYSGSWGNQGHRPGRQETSPIGQAHDDRFPAGTRTGAIKPGQPPAKNLLGMPWRAALALQEDGWVLRNAIVWHKPNAMPESVRDRLTTRYELVFLFSKSPRYWFDLDAVRLPYDGDRALSRRAHKTANKPNTARGVWPPPDAVPATAPPQTNMGTAGQRHTAVHVKGRNPGDVWEIATRPLPEAHFAPFPVDLPRRCILAGCRPGGLVLDPFSGAGTTALAAQQLGRKAIGIDLNPEYHDIALRRMADGVLPFDVEAS